MSLQTKHIYEFGPFRLDAAEHLLLRDGEAVSDENRLAEDESNDDREEKS